MNKLAYATVIENSNPRDEDYVTGKFECLSCLFSEVRKEIGELVIDMKTSLIPENILSCLEVYTDDMEYYVQDVFEDLMEEEKNPKVICH